MNHDVLKEKLMKAFDGAVPFKARTRWGKFCREREISLHLNMDWVKDYRFFDFMRGCKELSYYHTEEGYFIEITPETIKSWGTTK